MRVVQRAAAAALFLFAAAPAAAQPAPAVHAREPQPVYARRQIVAAAHPLAAEAGLEILRAGGSAMDAAVAVQMVLGLVEPESSGIGGGAFLMHWSAPERRVRSYDGREAAPAAARPERFLDAEGRPLDFMRAAASGRSVGVPGVLRMLEFAQRRHGRLPWARLFAPAIRLAEGGFRISPRLHQMLAQDGHLRLDAAARRLWYLEDGAAKPAGTLVVNPEYAAVLREIAARGAQAFYSGPIAADIVRAVRAHATPGDLSADDLLAYVAKEREPVCGAYRGYRICGMGPPSSGGIAVLQMLDILRHTSFGHLPAEDAGALHLFAEAGRLAYADRARYVADPDFLRVPVEGLLAPAYIERRAARIGERSMGEAPPGRPESAPPLSAVPDTESVGTSHFSIVDAEGDAVAMTTSVENAFGSRIMVRGFLLNNELTDFNFLPGTAALPAANRVEPGKRPRSSMAPTLVFAPDGSLQAAIGSPGGPVIINYVAKTLIGMLDWGLDVQAAIALPNLGSLNGPTLVERGTRYEALGEALAERGHELRVIPLTSGLHGIERVPGGWRGGADPRREGVAVGD